MSLRVLILKKRKIRERKVLEESEEHIQISDSLCKQITELGETRIESYIRIMEPLFEEIELKSIEAAVKSKMFKFKIPAKLLEEIEYKGIIFKPVRYHVYVKSRDLKPFKLTSYIPSPKRYILIKPIFSRAKTMAYVTTSNRYLLNKVLLMKLKVNINVDEEKIVELVKIGSNLEYKILAKVDLENILTEEEKKKGIWFGGSKYIGEPIVFVVNDDLWYLIAELCKEYYRQVRGDFPKPHILTIEDEGDLEKLANLVELGEKVDKRIIIIRLLGKDIKSYVSKPEFNKIMKRVINELFSQGLGFLVLTIDPQIEDMSVLIDELSRKIKNEFTEFYIPKLIKIKAIPIEAIPLLENYIRQIYGIEEFKWTPSLRSLRIVGYRIAEAERLYKDLLDEVLRFNKYLYKVKLHRVGDKKESEDHLALKTLVVKNLIDNYNVDPKDIETEAEIYKGGPIADVYVQRRGWVIEVETLFDSGAAPILRIRDTVLKYKDIHSVQRIWVVIRNMPVLLHFRSLLQLLKYLRDEMKDKEIEFYTINVSKGTLTNILEIRKQVLKHLSKYSVKELSRS